MLAIQHTYDVIDDILHVMMKWSVASSATCNATEEQTTMLSLVLCTSPLVWKHGLTNLAAEFK